MCFGEKLESCCLDPVTGFLGMGFATQVHMTVDLIQFVPLLRMNF